MINIILEDSNIKNGGQCPSKIQKKVAPKTLPAIGVGMIQQHQLWSNIIIFRVTDCSIGFRNIKKTAIFHGSSRTGWPYQGHQWVDSIEHVGKNIWGQWNIFGDFNSMELKNHAWFPRKGRSFFDNPFEWGPLLTSQATVPQQGLPKWAWNGVSLQEIKYSQITYHQLISTIINLHQMGDHGLKIV